MPFAKGQSGNPKGRPKGSGNKDTASLKSRIKSILENNADRLQDELDSLEPKEFIGAYVKLLEYAVPKLNRKEPTFDATDIDEDTINEIYDMIMRKLEANR